MKNYLKLLTYLRTVLLFLILPGLVFGQKKWSIDSLLIKELNLVPVPSLVISSEVGVMYGLFIDYKTTSEEDTTTRPSLSFIDFQYSTLFCKISDFAVV